MKKLWDSLVRAYTQKANIWLYAMLLSISVLPLLFKSLAMLIQQNAISVWLVILFDCLGWVAAWLFFIAAIWFMDGQHKTNYLRLLWQVFYKAGVWLIAIALFSAIINTLYVTYGAFLAVIGSTVLYMIGLVLISLIIVFVISTLVFWILCIMADPSLSTSFRQSFRYWIHKPILVLGTTLSAGVTLFLLPLLYDLIIKNFPGLALSFLELASGIVLLSLMQWLILAPLLIILFRHARQQFALITPAATAAAANPVPRSFFKKQIPVIVAVSLILVAVAVNLINGFPVSSLTAVKQDIQQYLSNEELMAADGDFAAAAYYHRLAEARVLAWQGAVLDKANALSQAVVLAPSDEQVLLLFALKNGNTLATLEQGFMSNQHTQGWYLTLLDAYNQSTSLTEIQKLRKAELLRICILQGYFLNPTILPTDFKSEQDNFATMIGDFEQSLIPGKQYALLARVGEEGYVTKQLVLDALALSESYPDEIHLQYLAMSYGSTLLQDNADHYKRTAAAAIRYDALYAAQLANTASEAENIREKLTVAKALMACNELAASATFLEDVNYNSTELTMLKASCLFSLKKYDKCLTAASALLKVQPDNPEALYLAAISTLQIKKTTNSIQYAISLAKLVLKAEDPLETESLLYPYLLRFTINDASGGYTTEAYSTMTAEDLALLKSNEFLYNYATAAHLWATNNADNRIEALTLLDKVLASKKNLSRALYIKGAIYHEQQNNEKSLECLKASLALDEEQPTVWYTLATLYDRMQKYEEAYAACEKVLDYLPATDHASDVFGLSPHASMLMDRLRQYIKVGD